jgi:hypothetical protein
MPYLTLYVLLGICLAVLAWIGQRLFRDRRIERRHSGGSSRRWRKWFRKSHHHEH